MSSLWLEVLPVQVLSLGKAPSVQFCVTFAPCAVASFLRAGACAGVQLGEVQCVH